ncbi:Ff.00g110260.m01.CDS01 [Fusarium sp. VM40]|nr:Ff.00g110260.m01.CDS01 [Fusarium sp. VM40]
MRAVRSTFLTLGLSVLTAASDEDVVSFPAIGEVDVVFPRQDTYAAEAPFPVIFGLQNAPVLTTFSDFLPDTEPYYFLNTSQAIADADEDQFQYWRSEEDSCILKWDFRWTTVCEPRSDGSVLLKNNQFERSGNVSFNLRPGAKTARKAIAEYDGCAIGGTAIKLERNHTVGCPILANDASPKPKPCDLYVKRARSSLAAAVVKPTTSLTEFPSKTTDLGVRTTGTGSDSSSEPSSTEEASGSGNSSKGDDGNGAYRQSFGITVILTLITASVLLKSVL